MLYSLKLSCIQTDVVVSVLYADSWTKFFWEKESNLRSFLKVLLKVMFSNSNGGPSGAQNSQDKGTGLIGPVKSSAGESFFSDHQPPLMLLWAPSKRTVNEGLLIMSEGVKRCVFWVIFSRGIFQVGVAGVFGLTWECRQSDTIKRMDHHLLENPRACQDNCSEECVNEIWGVS